MENEGNLLHGINRGWYTPDPTWDRGKLRSGRDMFAKYIARAVRLGQTPHHEQVLAFGRYDDLLVTYERGTNT